MPLSKEQQAVASIVLGASQGRLALAGGAALIFHGVTDRMTKDLDTFAGDHSTSIPEVSAAVVQSLKASGYMIDDRTPEGAEEHIRKLFVSKPSKKVGRPPETVQVDIGKDFHSSPPVGTRLGPTLNLLDLAANKLLAARDRVAPRDADDIARLAVRFEFSEMFSQACSKEPDPLPRELWAEGFRRVAEEDPDFFPDPASAPEVKEYMRGLADHLDTGAPVPQSPYV